MKGNETADLSLSDNGVLQGPKIGQISDIGKLVDWAPNNTFEALAALVLMCNETYINGQSRLEALWRTFVTNQTHDRNPAPEMVGQLFFHFLRAYFRRTYQRQIREIVDSAKDAKAGESIKTDLPIVTKCRQTRRIRYFETNAKHVWGSRILCWAYTGRA